MTTGRALVLDCDGVLADTERDGHLVAFNQAFAELGHDLSWSADEYKPLLAIGGGKERLRAYLQAHPSVDLARGGDLDEAVAVVHRRKSEIYVELVDAGALPGRPGVRRLVDEALEVGWQVAVASTSSARSVEAVLRSVVGTDAFSRTSGVFAGDVVPAKKPAPDIYELALRELGRGLDEVVVIEDSAPGALAARRAGLAHLVTVSYFTADEEFPGATAVLDHLGEPGTPATVQAGADVRNADGVIDVGSLEATLRHSERAGG